MADCASSVQSSVCPARTRVWTVSASGVAGRATLAYHRGHGLRTVSPELPGWCLA